jgi:DNA-binding IclR family transcriptional regulator
MHVATVSRIVSRLVYYGYLNQAEKRGKYMLGTKFLEFSAVIEQTNILKRIAMPYLIKLYKLVDETVGIFEWDGKRLIFLDYVRSKYLPVSPNQYHPYFPLYCTAMGKIVLANMNTRNLQAYFRNNSLQPQTPYTITDSDELKKQILNIAHEGVAFDYEEDRLGIRNIAAGVKNADNRIIACVGLIGPTSRLTDERMPELAPYVKKCAAEISRKLIYEDRHRHTQMKEEPSAVEQLIEYYE